MIKEILLLHHSHYDRGYMHHPEIEDALQVDYLRQLLDYCKRHPHAKWTAEVTRPVKLLLEECERQGDAETVEAFAGLVQAGRVGIGALATHVAPLADAQQLRELVDDVPMIREKLGAPVRTAFMHDINGLPWPVADVMLDAGVELFVTAINRAGYGEVPVGYQKLFKWRTPQGRELLVFNSDHYGAFNRESFHPAGGSLEEMREGWEAYHKYILSQGHDLDFCYLTATHKQPCDCNPADDEVAGLVARWNREKVGPPIRFVTGEELLEHLKQNYPHEIKTYSGDWTDWWNFGSASVPKHVALARRARRSLRWAEQVQGHGADPRIVGAEKRMAQAKETAAEKLGIWNEHTFGGYQMAGSWDSVQSQISSEQKNSLANEGFVWADLAARLELERLSGNPRQGRGYTSCLVANPSPREVTVYPWVDRDWAKEPLQSHNQAWMHHASARLDYLKPEEMCALAPVVVPPYGTVNVPMESSAVEAAFEQSDSSFSNPWREIRFDPATGRVLEIVDVQTGEPLFKDAGGYGFAEPVGERAKTRHPRKVEGDVAIDLGQSVWMGLEPQGHTIWLVRKHLMACGHQVTSRVGLSALNAEIAVEWRLTLADTQEVNALYAAFPTNLKADWRAWFDTAGQLVELDAEQLPLANRDYPTLDSMAKMADDTQTVRMESPDAPVVMFGDLNFGKMSRAQERMAQPALLSFVYNNYWDTNCAISQPGTFPLRWMLNYGDSGNTQAPWSMDYLLHPVVGQACAPSSV